MNKRNVLKTLIASMILIVVMIICILVSAKISSKKEKVRLTFEERTGGDTVETASDGEPGKEESETTAEATEVSEEVTTEVTEALEEATTEEAEETPKEWYKRKEYGPEDDKTAPVFLSFTKNVYIKKGEEFDIHKYIGYADDIDRDVELKLSDEISTEEEGTFPLKVTITDDTEKSTTWDMTVNVVSEMPKGGGESEKYAWADFAARYKNDSTMVGIDVSRWQEDIDFEKVKAAGCEFVIMRVGGYDDGTLYRDGRFDKNLKNAKAAGLKIGIYWHAEESDPVEVKNSVDYMMDILDGEKLDFPIAYDWEDFMCFENHGMNLHDINDLLDTFAAEVETHGYTASIYGSKNYLINVWDAKERHKVWLAHYVGETDYQGDYYMWQKSSVGKLDGVTTDVDFDVYYIPSED